MHNESSPLAGKEVEIKFGDLAGQTYRVEDWWDKVAGRSWMNCDGNPACMGYAIRTGLQDFNVPSNNEVLYGKIGIFGHLVHISEIGENE